MANFEIYGPKDGLTQWDINRKMIVSVICDQVHFANRSTKKALVCEVYDIGDQRAVDVPNILLQNSEVLEVYAYVCNVDESYTKVSAMFPVTGRPKPEDYVYTETEVLNYKSLNDRIKQLEQDSASADDIAKAIEDYLTKNPPDVAVDSVNGKTGSVELTAEDVGAISQDELQNAVDDALAQAKESGAFDGKDGDDYILTDADKTEIAEITASIIDTALLSAIGSGVLE